jgi:hypothetical protein
MSETRIRYGLAYGRMNNFYTGVAGQKGYLAGTDGLLAQGNTAPDVSLGYLFYTNNSGATTITDFQVYVGNQGGNQAPMFEGKAIKILFLDTNTTIAGSRIYLANSENTFTSNAVLDLLYHGSAWYEMSRTGNSKDMVSFTLGASQGLNANQTKSILFSGESALVVVSVSNGYVGQSLYLVNGGCAQTITISTAGNIRISHGSFVTTSGNQITIRSDGTAHLFKASPTIWSLIGLL